MSIDHEKELELKTEFFTYLNDNMCEINEISQYLEDNYMFENKDELLEHVDALNDVTSRIGSDLLGDMREHVYELYHDNLKDMLELEITKDHLNQEDPQDQSIYSELVNKIYESDEKELYLEAIDKVLKEYEDVYNDGEENNNEEQNDENELKSDEECSIQSEDYEED